jgi:hypothetical protein
MATKFHTNKHRSMMVKLGGQLVRFESGTAEVPHNLVARFEEFAKAHPEFEIERGETRLTAKQQLQADAQELGLDESGTSAELEQRIAEHKAAQDAAEAGESADDSDSQESDDQNDESHEEQAAEPDSSEGDQN